MPGLRVVRDQGVAVLVPPLHHRVVTARVAVGSSAAALGEARATFEDALRSLEADYPLTPAGLCVTVAWGLPYFRRFVPAQARRAIPIDLRASAAAGRDVRVVEDASRFPSDPATTVLEANDVAVLLRSDSLAAIDDAQARLFDRLPGLFAPTSVRSGFVGGGLGRRREPAEGDGDAGQDPRRRAHPGEGGALPRLHLDGHARARPGQDRQLRDAGLREARRPVLRRRHAHAPLASLRGRQRVVPQLRPGRSGRRDVPAGARDRVDEADGQAERARRPDDRLGAQRLRAPSPHRARRQRSRRPRASRRTSSPRTARVYPKGTAVPQRADFNTLDNPFAWSASPVRDRMREQPAEGVHFVVFNPTGDDFRRVRLAMDGVLPGGVHLPLAPRSFGQGINSVFHATHRQNFLVPPRAHRSFPLSELRS